MSRYKGIIYLRQTICFRPPNVTSITQVPLIFPSDVVGPWKNSFITLWWALYFFRKHFMLPDSPQIKHINKMNCAKGQCHWANSSIVSENLCRLKLNSLRIYMVTFTLIYKTCNSLISGKDKQYFVLINKIRAFKYWESSL